MKRRLIVITRKGVFGKGFLTTISESKAKKILARSVKKYGYATTMRRLNALAILHRGVSEKARRRAEKLKKWLKSKYGGK